MRMSFLFKVMLVALVLVMASLPVGQASAQGLSQSNAAFDWGAGSRCNVATAKAAISGATFLLTWYAGNPFAFLYKFYTMVDLVGQEWYICGHFGN
jgi:hypothetical protein